MDGQPPGHGSRRAADEHDRLATAARSAPRRWSRSLETGRTPSSRSSGTRSSHLPTSDRSSGADGSGAGSSTTKTPGAGVPDRPPPRDGAVGHEADLADQVGGASVVGHWPRARGSEGKGGRSWPGGAFAWSSVSSHHHGERTRRAGPASAARARRTPRAASRARRRASAALVVGGARGRDRGRRASSAARSGRPETVAAASPSASIAVRRDGIRASSGSPPTAPSASPTSMASATASAVRPSAVARPVGHARRRARPARPPSRHGRRPGQGPPGASRQAARKKLQIPGVSVAILWDDGRRWLGASGLRDVAAGDPMTTGTAFALASVSKTLDRRRGAAARRGGEALARPAGRAPAAGLRHEPEDHRPHAARPHERPARLLPEREDRQPAPARPRTPPGPPSGPGRTCRTSARSRASSGSTRTRTTCSSASSCRR